MSCLFWSAALLFATIISKQQKLPLSRKEFEFEHDHCEVTWHINRQIKWLQKQKVTIYVTELQDVHVPSINQYFF